MPNAAPRTPAGVQFFKRHARSLTIVGGMIVFTTFVVKDNLRDGWRADAESLETARYFYTISDSTRQQNNEFRHLQIDVGTIFQKVLSTPVATPQIDSEILGDVWADSENAKMYRAMIEETAIIVERLPEDDPAHKKLEQLRATLSKLDDLMQKCGDADRTLHSMDSDMSIPRENVQKQLELTTEYADEASSTYGRLRSGDADFMGDVLADAEKKQAQEKRYAKIANVVSIVCYVSGWGLGIVGNFTASIA